MLYFMESMLYTPCMIDKKSVFPEAVQMGRHYPFWSDLKLNAWALVAVALAVASRIFLGQHPDWAISLRTAIALSPLLPSLLHVRSIACWIHGMDELQRRIQLEALLFAAFGTIFITTSVSLLNSSSIHVPRLQNGLGWEGTFATLVFFYIIGNFKMNRRYK